MGSTAEWRRKKKISDYGVRIKETTQPEQQRKQAEGNERGLRDRWNYHKRPNDDTNRSAESQEEEKARVLQKYSAK